VYILTCKHVLEELGTWAIEELEAKLITQGQFIDLALLYVKGLHLNPLSLHTDCCVDERVNVIGFSNFNQNFHQKHLIEAKLYDAPIELHSSTDERYYEMRKIKSVEDYTFSRGNSGSPVICQSTGEVIAILSNKQGHNLAYAIPIVYLADIWKEMPSDLINEEKLPKTTTTPLEENLNNLTLTLVKNGWLGKRVYNKVKAFQSNNKFFRNIILDNKRLHTATTFSKVKQKIKTLFSFIFWTIALILVGYWAFVSFAVLNYKVTNIRKGSMLNVRQGMNTKHKIIAELPSSAKHIIVQQCKVNVLGKKWCKIQYYNTQGWVRSKYIMIDKVTLK
jgi:hypothetical protein